jgi:enterobactin synthetase component F
MVADYIEQIRTVQGTGPYHLLGWSFGGALAHAIAVRLQDQGERVALLSMLDAFPMGTHETTGAIPHEHEILAAVLQAAGLDPLASLREHPALGERPLNAVTEVCTHFLTKLLPTVVEGVFDGDLLYFHATEGKPADAPSSQAWRPLVTGHIEHHDVPCTHSAMTQTAALARVGRHLTAYLDAAHAR